MSTIPLEDLFTDLLGKSQRGLKLTDEALAVEAGITVDDLNRVKGGDIDETILRRLAAPLKLGAASLCDSARKAWFPGPVAVPGLAQFNTPFMDMTVNSYLVWDPATRRAVAFDTGADCVGMLQFARDNDLKIELILLTHTHGDHIADLARLKQETGAPAWVGHLEPTEGAQTFEAGRTFDVGGLRIETRLTCGHSPGGISYLIAGLTRPVAVVGDALFAGSMGGGGVSWSDALANNRKHLFVLDPSTVVCPGHGPLTTLGEEQRHNPFYPEFQKN